MPYLARHGARIYYEKHGAGPGLLFAHGLGGNHLSWWQQVPHFRDRYTCVVFAHRGFWPSEDTPAGPHPDAFVDDLAALIDHLGLDDVRLVAQSMGGWTCLGYALREPERVRALVMADTPGLLAPDAEELAELERLNDASARLFARGVHPAAGERLAREQPRLHHLYQAVNDLSPSLDKLALRTRLHALRTTPPAVVASLRPPLLCVWGEEDTVIPRRSVERLASIVPGARLEVVPRAGHSVYFERPEVFNRLLDEFFAGVDGRAAARAGKATAR
jgi:pimeloyl-ACP methyl ester carboxylesterase